MRKIISAGLILFGIIIILYPTVIEKYQMYQQKKLMAMWQESLLIVDKGSTDESEIYEMDFADGINEYVEGYMEQQELQKKQADELAKLAEKDKKAREKQAREEYIKKNLDGILQIEKIKLNLPILKGATAKNMDISITSMEHSGKIGEIGNYAITGHRNTTFGRNFNRLDEIEIGDEIVANDGEQSYKYVVVDKLYVLPEDTSVLLGNNIDKEITLITCHPMVNATHRLIIKGKIIE